MNSIFLWILLPMLSGALLLVLARYKELVRVLLTALSFFLAWLAWQVPIDQAVELGPITTKIVPSLTLFGRIFTLGEAEQPLLALLYLALGLWLLGSYLSQPGPLFPSTATLMLTLLIAALAVEPFLYAALLIALAVLISLPLVSPPGAAFGPGALRYFTFTLFGVPFILFAGWLLTGIEASPGNQVLVLRAGLLIALGFVFLIGIFPFHSWMPMLGRETHPYVLAFILLFLPGVIGLFGLSFIDRYSWIREREAVYEILLAIGGLVTLMAGIWAAIQRHLGRQFAYAAVMEVGLSLMVIGLGGEKAVALYFALFIPRMLAFLLWAIALSGLRASASGSLDLDVVSASVHRHPLLLVGLLAGLFGLAGIPLLGAFIPKLTLWEEAYFTAPLAASLALLGLLAFFIGGVRIFYSLGVAAFADRSEQLARSLTADSLVPDVESPYAWLYFGIGSVLLLAMGLLPQLFFGNLARFAALFPQLAP